jgi:hypothetical protein
MYTIFTRDTLCENQTQKLAQIGLFVEDAAKLWSMQEGFDMSFDSKKEVSHVSIKEQIEGVVEKNHANYPKKKQCPFRPIFDLIHEIKTEVKEEIVWQFESASKQVQGSVDDFSMGMHSFTNKYGEPKSFIPQMPQFTPVMPEMDFFMPQ